MGRWPAADQTVRTDAWTMTDLVHQPYGSAEAASSGSAWHSLDREDIEILLDTGPGGLSAAEAVARLKRHGPNRLAESAPPSLLSTLLQQFRSPLIFILLVAVVVTVVLGEHVDAAVIAAVLVLNAGIGLVQERKAEHSVRALMHLVAPRARVIRGGREFDVDSGSVVPGELVLLESGSRIPADLRLASVTGLTVDESLLTGESAPVAKHARPLNAAVVLNDRANMAYTGTVVTSGRSRGYVVATGDATELGRIAEQMREQPDPETPLQRRLARFAKIVGAAVVIAGAAAFAFGVVVGESAADMFLIAVALGVSAVPEGLPVVFTVALALGVRRMARRQAIIRRLAAVETIGSVTAIGSDKTGTLTQNRMSVQEVWAAGRSFTIEGDGYDGGSLVADGTTVSLTEYPVVYLTLLAGVLSNEAVVYRDEHGLTTQGDPTEAALLVAAARLGVEPDEERERHPIVAELPFEPERQHSASVRRRDGAHWVFVKGAPERVLRMCSSQHDGSGLAQLDPARIERDAAGYAARGLRVLAMAFARLPEDGADEIDLPPLEDLVFLGLQAMMDPPRPEVREAIAGCRSAGIRVLMITGDHGETAKAVAADIGIMEHGEMGVLAGSDLAHMSEDALAERVRDVAVFARVTPKDKLRIVRALQRNGHVVAVTGDGINDAPALKAAEIGVAMGLGGTDVAREAADMVLADDNFVSVYRAVEQGRITFDNLRKTTFFLVSTAAAEVAAILTALGLRWPLLFLPAQILWLNLVTNGLQDVALAFEPGEPGVLERPPRRPGSGILSPLLWERTAVTGLVMAAGTLLVFGWGLRMGGSLVQAQTAAITTMVLFQAFHAGNARSEHVSIIRMNVFGNRFLLASVIAALAVHIGAMHWSATQFVLRFEPFPAVMWPVIVMVAASVLVSNEIHKFLRRGRTLIDG